MPVKDGVWLWGLIRVYRGYRDAEEDSGFWLFECSVQGL